MSLFKGLKESKERKKARDFFDNAPKLKGDPREIRKLKALLGRTTAFIDTTFIEGAETMQKWQSQTLQTRTNHLQCRLHIKEIKPSVA